MSKDTASGIHEIGHKIKVGSGKPAWLWGFVAVFVNLLLHNHAALLLNILLLIQMPVLTRACTAVGYVIRVSLALHSTRQFN